MTEPGGRANFEPTRWTLVRRAAERGSDDGAAALEELCRAYWYPLFVYLRRRGHPPDRAADLVQGLFAQLLERDGLARLNPEGGRFRGWLLTALERHAKDERVKEHALKRGGGRSPIALDGDAAETRYRLEPADPRAVDPERAFNRRWALTVLDRARARVGDDYASRGQTEVFEALSDHLVPGADPPRHAAVAERLGLREVAVRVALHRLRERYRERLREEVRATLGSDLEPGAELAELERALR